MASIKEVTIVVSLGSETLNIDSISYKILLSSNVILETEAFTYIFKFVDNIIVSIKEANMIHSGKMKGIKKARAMQHMWPTPEFNAVQY